MKNLALEFEKFKTNNKMGHAFLLYNVNYDKIEKDLVSIINSSFFDLENNIPEIYFIEPLKNTITKDQIKDLQQYLKNYSQINENKVYVIKECDKMNLSAANSILKILEEPQSNIFAFLITEDVEKVLPTISSRCIKIFIENKNFLLDEEDKEKYIEIISLLCKKDNDKNIYKLYELLQKNDKNGLNTIIENLIILLKDLLNLLYKVKLENYLEDEITFLSKYFSEDDLIKKIEFLNDIRNRLDYNINTNMFVDKLLINW